MVQGKKIRQIAAVLGTCCLATVVFDTTSRAARAEEARCSTSDEEYRVVASVLVRDTLFGAADGVYPLGSGRLRLRVDEEPGGESVKLMSYELQGKLTVKAGVAMFSTNVVTESRATAGSGVCGGSADGTLHGDHLTWSTAISDYHSEGTISCSGSMCGRFGAPPAGLSPIPDAGASLRFGTFTFSPDGSTFTMPYTLVSRSTSPRQSTYLALSGRRVTHACATTASSC